MKDKELREEVEEIKCELLNLSICCRDLAAELKARTKTLGNLEAELHCYGHMAEESLNRARGSESADLNIQAILDHLGIRIEHQKAKHVAVKR